MFERAPAPRASTTSRSRPGASGPVVLHLSGERDYDELQPRVRRPDYHLLPTVEDFGAALSAVDLALSRSGGTVWELAAADCLPCSSRTRMRRPTTRRRTLGYFERGGGAVVVPESRLSDAAGIVESLLADDARLRAMSEAMRGLAKEDAADRIAEEVLALAATGR